MEKKDVAWALAVIGAVAICVWAVVQAVKAAAPIATALVSVAGAVVVGVIRHAAELEKQRIHEEFLQKRDNYKDLLAKVGDLVAGESDEKQVIRAHLASWAFGDPTVMLATNRALALLAKTPSESGEREAVLRDRRTALLDLLKAVRTSLQGASVSEKFEEEYNFDALFGSGKFS